MTRLIYWGSAALKEPALKPALIIFGMMRLFLSIWAVVSLALNPLPVEPDEQLRPYLGEPQFRKGAAGLLLGPWQRFDTQRYMSMASQGYLDERNSVFPPLYPMAVRAVGSLMGGQPVHNLAAGILLSNLACLALFLLFHRVVASEIDNSSANRALLYLAIFPTGFFLFAAYTESIFMLFALGSLWAARRGRFWISGALGFLASLTRLTGWVLVVPLAYEYWTQKVRMPAADSQIRQHGSSRLDPRGLLLAVTKPAMAAILLPGIALLLFIAWRWSAGLPPLNSVYARYWHQTTAFPGLDLIKAARTLFFDGQARDNELISLAVDMLVSILLIATTVLAFRRLGTTYGLYSTLLLLFILLPSSDVKPLYSFSRYALAFFPMFMLMASAGRRPWINRLILYPSLLLYLYFSGQFFVWGWVA